MVVTKYQKRISGSLLDRIDIHVGIPQVNYKKLSGNKEASHLKQFALECKLREIFNKPVSRTPIPNPPKLFATLTCISARSENSASCRTKVRA